jgi:hypothetical protein
MSKKIDKLIYKFKNNIIFKEYRMKRIIVKEIDKLKSSAFDDKVITEYLIYLVLNQGSGDIKLEGFTEYGEKNKDARINELIIEHFINNETLSKINKKDIIEEISFENYINN